MGDGCVSLHTGDLVSRLESMFQCGGNVVDTALSLVHIKNHLPNKNIRGFDRISTRKTVVIVNNIISPAKSKIYNFLQPGIGIFDFEASLQTDRIIDKSDIFIQSCDRNVKLLKKDNINIISAYNEKKTQYTCEVSSLNNYFQFAVKREISVEPNKTKIEVSEFAYTSIESQVFVRIILPVDAIINKTSASLVHIEYNSNRYVLSVKNLLNSTEELHVKTNTTKLPYPIIIIYWKNQGDTKSQINWCIENEGECK
jgi:hypothetical protein